MPETRFIPLSDAAQTLYRAGYKRTNQLDLLRDSKLKAVLQYPDPLPGGQRHPYPIPPSVWQSMSDREYVVRKRITEDGRRRYEQRYLSINIDFAIEATIQELKVLIALASERNADLFRAPEAELHLSVEIRKNGPDGRRWDSVLAALLDRLVAVAGESNRLRFVYVLSEEFREFQQTFKIRGRGKAGRRRLPRKDNMWAEILKRFYIVHKRETVSKNRAKTVIDWMKTQYGQSISEQTVLDVLGVIDQLAEGKL